MEIEWLPVYSKTNNRTLEMQAILEDSSIIEIWSDRITSGLKYYFTILKFETINSVNGFDSLEDCQNFVQKNWDVL